MGLLGKFKNNKVEAKIVGDNYQAFSTPFIQVPQGNLSLPFIYDGYRGRNYVPFGETNLFPSVIDQLYYTSPLHGSIVDFKVNASIGGGYEIDTSQMDAKEKVALYGFEKKVNLDKILKTICEAEILHNRVYFKVTIKNGKASKYEYIPSAKVRTNKTKDIYTISDDWSRNANGEELLPYDKDCVDGCYILCFENMTTGQDIYPVPRYTSANNFAFLSGELSYLSKSNIQNAVFPSFAIKFPKKPQNNEELQQIKDTVNKMKGAENAGKAVAFFANNKEQLPELDPIPVNNNDSLFQEASTLNTEQICFAHTIDPILMGVRTTGSLGSGSDIKQAYVIFEKNVIIPLRQRVEDIVNTMLKLSGVDAEIVLNNYQIIDETITEVEEDEVVSALSALPDDIRAVVLSNMTADELRELANLKPLGL